MTLEEIKYQKHLLENSILDLIRAYEEKTKTKITHIKIDNLETYGYGKSVPQRHSAILTTVEIE